MIQVENISKSYGTTKAVNNISFRVRKGDVLGFLGPNGAGKSTTMRMLTCYLSPDEGTARIDGFDIHQDPIEIRKKIGYLPENNPLYLDMGVIEYLKFIAKIRQIPKSSLKTKVDRAIEICGLGSYCHKDIGELSKGYRQRLGLAQALIHDPEVLILDEPTIGLDPHQIIEIRHLIKSIGGEKTIIISSHILPEISATCDRVLIIAKGQIVGSGTPQELASMTGGGLTINTGIRGPRENVMNALNHLEGAVGIKHIDEKNGVNSFKLTADKDKDLTEEIFFMVSKNGWSLTELHREEINLEDVFLDLTTKEAS